MPNGWRRGGRVWRGGRSHYRRGSRIAPPAAVVVVGLGLVGLSLLGGGTPILTNPGLVVGLVAAACVVLVAARTVRNRRDTSRTVRAAHTRQREAEARKRVAAKAAARRRREAARRVRWAARASEDRAGKPIRLPSHS